MSIDVISGSEKLVGEKIRYINYEDVNYFIYTLNELDEEGYQKLYINKISNGEEDIISDFEWEELKIIIPTIVKQIKSNNITDFEDLELTEIEKINSDYSKPFKLKSSIVDSIKKEEKINKIDEELQELIGGISKKDSNSVDELDEFLNNYEDELDDYEEDLKKIEAPIRPNSELNNNSDDIESLKDELQREKNEKEALEKKNEKLQSELNQYKDKLERIKIMLEA